MCLLERLASGKPIVILYGRKTVCACDECKKNPRMEYHVISGRAVKTVKGEIIQNKQSNIEEGDFDIETEEQNT